MHKITVAPLGAQWMAYLDDNKQLWESGETIDEAIGRLVRIYSAQLGITVVKEV